MSTWIEAFTKWKNEQPATAFNQQNVKALFYELKSDGVLPSRLSFTDFIEQTVGNGLVRPAIVKHVGKANPSRREIVRYLVNDPSPFTVALSLRSKSYISHVSALFLHGLTEQVPHTIFVNKEQSAKNGNSGLSQVGIDRAFKGKGRRSQYIWAFDQARITMLNGKQSGDYGVEPFALSATEEVRVTNLERTMVDIVVRPGYSGGPLEVLKAFKEMKERVSVDRILATLKELNYTYPYHQSIGFAMQRAGYDSDVVDHFRSFPIEYDFYFDYNIRDPEYDSLWRIYFPKGL